MKIIIQLALIIFAINYAFGQDKGLLTFFTEDGQKFWVILNGEKINQEPHYVVKEIPANFQYGKAKIIFENDKIKPITKNVQLIDIETGGWAHVKYMIKKGKKGNYVISNWDITYELLSSTTTTTQTQTTTTTHPEQNTTTQITSTTETVNISNTTTINETPTGVNSSVGVQITDPVTGQPVGVNVNVNFSENIAETSTTQLTQTNNTTTHQVYQPVENKPAHYVMPGYNGKIGCSWPMSSQDLQDAKKSISSKSFEDSKLTIAKQITSSNCLLCSQVKEIMSLFSFEDSRLEFAKFAYDFVYDLNNYYKLNDAFTFESSIDELNTYLKKKQ